MSLDDSRTAKSLVVERANKSYGANRVLADVSIEARPGEFLTFLGPSGCGKTTLLRVIAGFITPDSGDVRVDGTSVVRVPPNRRNFGFVFQSYALFAHLKVAGNIAYGLKLRKLAKDKVAQRVGEMLEIVNLSHLADRYPKQLSGGQQQRVALARALAISPDVLLLDEPLSNLDAKLRERIRVELRDLQKRVGITTIFVTHDQEEAMSMSDRIVVMNSGRIEQVGTPAEIYRLPATRFVADFVGANNLLPATIDGAANGTISASCLLGRLRLPANSPSCGKTGTICIRPEKLTISAAERPGAVSGTISAIEFLGPSIRYSVVTEGEHTLKVLVTDPVGQLEVGSRCWVACDADAGVLLPEAAEGAASNGGTA